jgi:hypothetical protein
MLRRISDGWHVLSFGTKQSATHRRVRPIARDGLGLGKREEDVVGYQTRLCFVWGVSVEVSFYLQAGSKPDGTTPIHPTGKKGDILGGEIFIIKYVNDEKISYIVI